MLSRRTVLAGLTGLGAAALVGCSEEAGPRPSASASRSAPPPDPTPTTVSPTLAGTVAEGLAVPWSIVFLASGSALVSQRDEGTVVRVDPDGTVTELGGVEGSRGGAGGEAGLLGLALDPDDETVLYAYMTTATDNRVVRLTLADDRLDGQETVLDGIPVGPRHQGGALLFDTDGTLFVATGEAGRPDLAQDRSSLGGKVLRIQRDGSPVADAPFDSPVWSYGHRNVEGLALDADGGLWASEFGDKAADELNRIRRGGNFGWPKVEGESDDPALVSPVATWPTDECSPAGLAIVRSTAFLGALQGECLWGVPLDGDTGGEPSAYLQGELGRLRAVAVAPDGSLWVGTSNTDGRGDPRGGDDRIVRVTL